jgi:hypothetical protein
MEDSKGPQVDRASESEDGYYAAQTQVLLLNAEGRHSVEFERDVGIADPNSVKVVWQSLCDHMTTVSITRCVSVADLSPLSACTGLRTLSCSMHTTVSEVESNLGGGKNVLEGRVLSAECKKAEC